MRGNYTTVEAVAKAEEVDFKKLEAKAEAEAVSFFFLIAGVISYSGVCALLGLRSRLPLFHGACVLHVGKLKDSPND